MDILYLFLFSVVLNMLLFIPAYIFKTDKITDISYAVTFASIAIFAFIRGEGTLYQTLLLIMILLWSIRLGGFLLRRVVVKGKDKRFDGTREVFLKFARFWFLQGLTVAVVMLAGFFALSSNVKNMDVLDLAGLAVFSFGLAIETIADQQKWTFTQNAKNKNKWIDIGVWSWSRHPNYLGEIMVWTGIYLYSVNALEGWQYLISLASPVYITLLLCFGSGIPILEKYADEKWGNDKEYQSYKQRVGILLPKL